MHPSKLSLYAALLVVFIAPHLPANEYTGSVEFSVEDLSIIEARGFHHVRFAEGVPSAAIGSPALPVIQMDVAIPWNAIVKNVVVLHADIVEIDGTFDVVPMTAPRTLSGRSKDEFSFIKDPLVYGRNSDCPGFHVEYLSSWELVGQKFAKLAFHPLQFNPQEMKLSLATRIDFKLLWDSTLDSGTQPAFNLTAQGRGYYESVLHERTLNPEDIEILPFAGLGSRVLPPGQYEHVIITPKRFESSWDSLLQWHIRKGIPDVVVTKKFIYANYSGANTDKIRSFIKDAHAAWGTRFFLIGAKGGPLDVQVPIHGRSLLDENVPNDTFYADYNDDWIVDVHVGRASVTSSEEIYQFIDKVIIYEKTPLLNIDNPDVFFLGSYLGGYTHELSVDGSHHVGEALSAHKNAHYPNNEHFRFLFTDLNLLGEPAMPAGLNNPASLAVSYEDVIFTGNQNYLVNVRAGETAMEGALVCLWKDGEVYVFDTTDSQGNIDFAIETVTCGTMCVTATAQGCIPHEGEIKVEEGMPPHVELVTPAEGTIEGGTACTLHGSYYIDAPATSVAFGGAQASKVVVVDENTITCETPPRESEGTVDVEVLTGFGAGALPMGYTYQAGPELRSVTPDNGPSAGNQAVVLSGTGFTFVGSTTVSFGDNSATDVVVVNSTTVTCNTPPGTPGLTDVTITDIFGSDTLVDGYTYNNPPSITGVNPTDGPIAGGTTVTISGADFTTTPDTTVTFGGNTASNLTVVDVNTITCDTPAHTAGTVDVTVTNGNGSDTLTNGFTYHNPPTILYVTPDNGPVAGGAPVTVIGSDFTTLGTTTVTFGGNTATNVVVVDTTLITCDTPAHAPGSVYVEVTNDFGSDTLVNGYTYNDPPALSSINPTDGPVAGGTSTTITGNHFTTTPDTTVTIGGAPATNLVVINATTLTCNTPGGPAGPADVVITNSNGSDTLVNGFTYHNPPSLISVSPNNGPESGGTAVTITGTDFTTLGTTSVTFGGASAANVAVTNTTAITCETPPGMAGLVDVEVTNDFGSDILVNGFAYNAPPSVFTANPGYGPAAGGTHVQITGEDFTSTPDTTVSFGGNAASNVEVVDSFTINCDTPAHSAGAVDVTVINTNGSGTLVDGFTYHDAPDITSVSPDNGPPAGGTTVTIMGTDFTPIGTTTVSFGGKNATDVVVDSSTAITCKTPVHASGAVDVVVINDFGSDTLVNGYYYNDAPEIDGITPEHGSVLGGTPVTITGNHFTTSGDTEVYFGSDPASNIVVVDPTTITCDTPAHAAGKVGLAVKNSNGLDFEPQAFTYHEIPTLTSISPSVGVPLEATEVTVRGTDFTSLGNPIVLFGGLPATDLIVENSSTITCKTPVYPIPDVVDVELVTDFGNDVLPGGFAFLFPAGEHPKNLTDVDTLDLYPDDVVRLSISGQAGSIYMLFLSFGPGPVNSLWGQVGLDMPVYYLWTGAINPLGFHNVSLTMPDLGIGFFNFYTHALVDDSPPVWAEGGNNPNDTGSIMWGLN
ncbi:MAG: IPT/TIG domain-containing protein [Planctomycetota bacterium]|jgi:hypothetical protein